MTDGSLRVLVAGANGLIGTELVHQLEAHGHRVSRLVRREATGSDEFEWDPAGHTINAKVLSKVDAVVNLTGATTGRIPWTNSYKKKILHSRIDTTRTLAEAMLVTDAPPATFINASASGYYGNRPGETLDEHSVRGDGFLADVVDAWEQAAHLADPVTRVVTVRTGLVVAAGGAFAPLALATKLGAAARVGHGDQVWPWVSLHDEAAAIVHLLESSVSGPVNLVGPVSATSEDATRALARALRRWHPFALPEALIKVGLGEAGDEMLLADQRVVPRVLLDDGFEFTHGSIDSAIDAVWPRG